MQDPAVAVPTQRDLLADLLVMQTAYQTCGLVHAGVT